LLLFSQLVIMLTNYQNLDGSETAFINNGINTSTSDQTSASKSSAVISCSRLHLVFLVLAAAAAFIAAIIISVVATRASMKPSSDSPSLLPPIDRFPIGWMNISGSAVLIAGTGDSVILLLPDVFGPTSDVIGVGMQYAAAGFTVLMIDEYDGQPWNGQGSVDIWKSYHPFTAIMLKVGLIIAEVQRRGYTSIQSQGYCYGGRVSILLAGSPAVKSAVAAHPSDLIPMDATLMTQPTFFVVPAVDPPFSTADVPLFNTTLNARGIEHLFIIYPNTTHGFATRGGTNPIANEMKQKAINDSIAWFSKHQ